MPDVLERLTTALADRYRIERELGRGGMAIVYLAHDLKHDRQVAVKVVQPELAAVIGAERFLNEIKVTANLQHPHILPLFDSGETQGFLYYVMPYVEGESLRMRLDRKHQLPVDEALSITREVADGLHYAHGRGIIHRDVKPENILLTAEHAIIADFGISLAVNKAGGTRLTESGVSLGTPEYMSPEQATGDQQLGPASDIYSLGAVLYEMLTGDPPHTGSTAKAVIARVISEKPASIRTVRDTVPEHVEQAAMKALAKIPADRPETAKRFVDMLDEPVPATWKLLLVNKRRRRRGVTLATVAVAVLGIALALWSVREGSTLDDNLVIVFPMTETGIRESPPGIGRIAALAIGNALEETVPLQWEDGWLSLDDDQRSNLDGVTNKERNAIARASGARYRLDGSIIATGDSASILLWLYDVKAGALLQRRIVTGASPEAAVMQLAILGVGDVLPVLLHPGRDAETILLEGHDLGAVGLWMLGNREYRASRFDAALSFYERAIAQDSAFAMAAFKAAQAASWTDNLEAAEEFVGIALEYESLLHEPLRYFAHGLHSFVTGSADSAVVWLRLALKSDPEWTEAHMALGEVFYHLLPAGEYPLDSLAEAEFRAASADSYFSPPLFHLTESAIRQGDVEEATVLTERYRKLNPESDAIVQLAIMLECLLGGADEFDWPRAVRQTPLQALLAAKALSAGGKQVRCAEGGFRAVLGDSAVAYLHWGAFLGYQGVLLATGRHQEFTALVDSMIQHRPPTMTLYLQAAIVNSQLNRKAIEAETFVKNTFGQEYQNSPSVRLWFTMGAWHAYRGDADLVGVLVDKLAGRTDERQARLFAENLTGQLAFLDGDPARAISVLRGQHSTSRPSSLFWEPEESLPSGRLLLANLLYESGLFLEAIHVASVFDHPAPVTYPGYAAASLSIRYRAAQALRNDRLVSEYRNRLLDLNRTDLVDEP